ncbi:MAG: type II toxin-antitoxin system HicB family antitoxin [Cyanobacteria bacterium P01_A01_bin.116]
MTVRVILEWDDEVQSYSATCPELNFVSSCGESREEVIANLKDAIQLMLEPIPEHLLDMKPPAEVMELAI